MKGSVDHQECRSDRPGEQERALPPILCQVWLAQWEQPDRPPRGVRRGQKFITYPPSDRLGFSLPSSEGTNRTRKKKRLALSLASHFAKFPDHLLHMPYDVLRRQR